MPIYFLKKILYLLTLLIFISCLNIQQEKNRPKKDNLNKETNIIQKKQKEKKRLEKAIKNRDIKTLKELINNKESLLPNEDKKLAFEKLKEFVKEELLKKIDLFFKTNNIEKIEELLQSEDAKYIPDNERIKITSKIREIKRVKILTKINKGIDDLDLQLIQNILNSKDSLYLTSSDKEFAQKYLNQYLKPDSFIYAYQQRKMEQQVRKVPDEIKNNIFIKPEKYIEPLVRNLIGKEDNVFIKVKIIHDWICDNIGYDTEMFLSGSIKNQDYVNVLKKKKGVSYGYSTLFKKMVEIAGLKECIIINGYAKNPEYKKFDYVTAHSWNAIKIGNKWYLVDCTFDAGTVSGKAFYFNKSYSTAYLFISPRANLYTHYPENPKYQFYIPIISLEKFLEEPFIQGSFFYYGLDIKEGEIKDNNVIEDENFSFTIKYNNNNTLITVKLEKGADILLDKNILLTKINANTYKIECTLKEKGLYYLNLYAKRREDKNFENPISIYKFESYFIPELEQLIKIGKIVENEKEIFLNSFTKVEKNNLYYYNEDLFDIKKINTCIKIMSLLGDSLNWHENVLSIRVEKK